MELMVFFINFSYCYSVPSLFLRKGTPVHVYEEYFFIIFFIFMRNIMIKCASCEHKKEFLSFKIKFLSFKIKFLSFKIKFLLLLLYKEKPPEIMSVYDL